MEEDGGSVTHDVEARLAALEGKDGGAVAHDVEARLEALKLVKDWSTALLVVQSGAIAVMGGLIEKRPPSGWLLGVVVAVFCTLILSIYLGAICVIGTIPYIAQHLPGSPTSDIYEGRGGLVRGGRPSPTLGTYCIWQSRLFLWSLILFALFVIGRT
jgi:hypothetical protein